MPAYTPRAGDTVRDAEHELWFVYGPEDALHAISADYNPAAKGQSIDHVTKWWGPLRLEHRPA